MSTDFKHSTVSLITSALGLAVALAFNSAIQELFEEDGPLGWTKKFGPWIYLILIVIISSVIVTSLKRV